MQPITTSDVAATRHATPQDRTDVARQHVGERLPIDVGNGGQLADAEREVAIQHAGREIEAAMARYAESSCFTDRADADRARRRMESLIRGRSAQQVRKLEEQRGLS